MTDYRDGELQDVLQDARDYRKISEFEVERIDPRASSCSFAMGARYTVDVERLPGYILDNIREAGFCVTAVKRHYEKTGVVRLYVDDDEEVDA